MTTQEKARAKGKRGELSLLSLLHKLGIKEAERVSNSVKNRTSDIEGLPGIHCEVTTKERLNITDELEKAEGKAAIDGYGETPAVFFKKNRGRWYIALPAEDFIKIYKGE